MQITVDDIFCHFQTQQTMLSSLIIDHNSKSHIYLLDVAFQENLSFFFLLRAHCVTRSVCLRWCFWGTPRWERARSSITTAAATSPITWPQLWVRDARHFMLLLNLIPVVCWHVMWWLIDRNGFSGQERDAWFNTSRSSTVGHRRAGEVRCPKNSFIEPIDWFT